MSKHRIRLFYKKNIQNKNPDYYETNFPNDSYTIFVH